MHICFLDIDGTLVLTGGAGQTAFGRTLTEDFGIETIDGSVPFAGRSDRAIAMDLFRSHGLAATEANWERFRVGYLSRLQNALTTHKGFVLPGVPDLLKALAARGDVALGLLTGNLREGARYKLSYYGLWDHFAFGGFGDEHMERCDIAAAALVAANSHLGCLGIGALDNGNRPTNGQVVVIGDTLHDISCGRSIGARCVAVPTGHTSAEVLRTGTPDVLVTTLEEMGPVLALFDCAGR
jgi:phosphoglycolate phosphatase